MCRSPGTKGLTLAEVMLAVCLVSVALLGLVAVYTYSARARRLSQGRLLASTVAVTLMTELEERMNSSEQAFAEAGPIPRTPLGSLIYAVDIQPRPEPRLKAVLVIVYYDENVGSREYRLWNLVHKLPD